MFTPSRLTLARQRRGLNKSGLADLTALKPRTITTYERGETEPTDATVEVFARALNFPLAFFSASAVEGLSANGVSFRALTRMTAPQRHSATAAGALALDLERWLSQRFDLPDVDIPELDRQIADPEGAAAVVRAAWGLGEEPLPNLIHLLEVHGVRIFSLAEDCRELDAFSWWHGDTPFMCLNTVKTAEHNRFDAAHELGHLVLHRGRGTPRGREEEREADAFASAFLMPRADVLAKAPSFPSFTDLVRAKKRWNVSVAALSHRLHKLGVLTDWHYRELCIELGRFGRRREPNPSAREHSQLLEKVFGLLRADGVTKADVASAIHIYLADLDALVFGLTVSVVPGGGGENAPASPPELRIVSSGSSES